MSTVTYTLQLPQIQNGAFFPEYVGIPADDVSIYIAEVISPTSVGPPLTSMWQPLTAVPPVRTNVFTFDGNPYGNYVVVTTDVSGLVFHNRYGVAWDTDQWGNPLDTATVYGAMESTEWSSYGGNPRWWNLNYSGYPLTAVWDRSYFEASLAVQPGISAITYNPATLEMVVDEVHRQNALSTYKPVQYSSDMYLAEAYVRPYQNGYVVAYQYVGVYPPTTNMSYTSFVVYPATPTGVYPPVGKFYSSVAAAEADLAGLPLIVSTFDSYIQTQQSPVDKFDTRSHTTYPLAGSGSMLSFALTGALVIGNTYYGPPRGTTQVSLTQELS